jgi:hypothetical protein
MNGIRIDRSAIRVNETPWAGKNNYFQIMSPM